MECASDAIQRDLVARYQNSSDDRNQLAFQKQFQMPQATDLVDQDISVRFRNTQFLPNTPTCNKGVILRGNNSSGCGSKQQGCDRNAGWSDYTPYSLQEYYLIPCREPNYRNSLRCDREKCCSEAHQMFGNLTRRKTSS